MSYKREPSYRGGITFSDAWLRRLQKAYKYLLILLLLVIYLQAESFLDGLSLSNRLKDGIGNILFFATTAAIYLLNKLRF